MKTKHIVILSPDRLRDCQYDLDVELIHPIYNKEELDELHNQHGDNFLSRFHSGQEVFVLSNTQQESLS